MKNYRRTLTLGLLAAAAVLLAGCNTFSGMGKDITAVSDKTSEWISGE